MANILDFISGLLSHPEGGKTNYGSLDAQQAESLARRGQDSDNSPFLDPTRKDTSVAGLPSRTLANLLGDFPAAIPPGLIHPLQTMRHVQDDALSTVSAIPEETRNSLARDSVGPWMVSHVSPYSYDPISHGLELLGLTPGNSVSRAESSDTSPKTKEHQENTDALRHELWRKYWNMPAENPNLWIRGDNNQMSLNPSAPEARSAIEEYQNGGRSMYIGKDPQLTARHFRPGVSSPTGHFIPGQPDPWNFDLHANEIPSKDDPYGPVKFIRALMEKFSGQNTPIVNTVYPK